MTSQFQGKEVHASKIALTGGAKEVMEKMPEIDEIVEVVIEGRVTGVDFRVDDKTGDLVKHVRIKVLEVAEVSTLTVPKTSTRPAEGGTVTTLADGRRVNTETGEVA